MHTYEDVNPAREVSDCVACLLRPIIRMGSICGISTAVISCPHSTKSKSMAQFEAAQTLRMISLMLSLPVVISIAYNFKVVLSLKDTKTDTLALIVEILFSTGATTSWIIGTVKHKQRLTELNGLSTIIENRQYYGMSSILSAKTTKGFLRTIYIIMVFVLILDINFMLGALTQWDYDPYLFILRNIATCFCTYVQAIAIFQCLLANCLYRAIFKKCFKKIKTILMQKMNGTCNKDYRISGRVIVLPVALPLEVNLQRLNRLYLGLTYNYRQMVIFMNPAFTIWWLILMALLILSFYFLVLIYTTDHYSDTLLAIRCYGSVFGITAYIANVQQINVLSEDILSFLFKYPISKLSTAEAAQVEMLITTLNIQKPVLRASDIFTVGTRLLASISGTVVTYVLVALQFHASWAKE